MTNQPFPRWGSTVLTGPWPSTDKASAFYGREKAGDPGFKSLRARHFLGADTLLMGV